MDDRTRLEIDFARVRDALGVPDSFSPAVLAAADVAASRVPIPKSERMRRADYSIVPFVTIDPEQAMDLDQAFYGQRREGGYIILYAIADVGYFVDEGGPVEGEALARGLTLYSPDGQTPLYPPSLSRGAASLLPGVERPSIVFSFELDDDASVRLCTVERAVVVSRAKLAYDRVSRHLAAERERPGGGEYAAAEWAESLEVLERVGRLRQSLEIARGGVSLPIAAQHVQRAAAALAGYGLAFRDPDDVEGWNAQISLMTGIEAARMMIRAGVGLLRALDDPEPGRLEALRLTATALGVEWPSERSYADFIRSLDPTRPLHAAVIFHAAGVMGSARYVAFDGAVPTGAHHAAIGGYYAHVTAPLRRLADRYVLDLLVDLGAGTAPPPHVARRLEALPEIMGEADRVSRRLESRMVDVAEAHLLAARTGDVFDALVVKVRADRVTVQIADPPVRADIPVERLNPAGPGGDRPRLEGDGSSVVDDGFRVTLGERLAVRLERVDVDGGRIRFGPA
jgi:exoribonuclease R